MEGKEVTEVVVCRDKVFRVVGEECETCEEERACGKDGQKLVEGVGEVW